MTAGAAEGDTQVVAVGSCSGTYCQNNFNYYVEFCKDLEPVQSCYTGHCCSTSDSLNMRRIDNRDECPPSTICQCDALGEGGASALTIKKFDGDEEVRHLSDANNPDASTSSCGAVYGGSSTL